MDITTLTVNVVDVVDPPPSFSMSQYIFTVNEGVANVSKQRNGVHLTVHGEFQIVHTIYFHSGFECPITRKLGEMLSICSFLVQMETWEISQSFHIAIMPDVWNVFYMSLAISLITRCLVFLKEAVSLF